MSIRPVTLAEYEDFVAFLNAGMRPEITATRAEDDFPVILSRDNLEGLWCMQDDTGWVAGLSVLTREFTTTLGSVKVAGIGSVVTRSDMRGKGLSKQLQTRVMGELAGQKVPLAVLWTDQPAVYAGRGFKEAGWEYHIDLAGARLAGLVPPGAEVRPFLPSDVTVVSMIYNAHPLRTLRQSGDNSKLYTMPGTKGLVLAKGRDVLAYAFCGKGDDFPDYVTEWGGEAESALAVMAEAHRQGLASRILVPAGREDILKIASRRGARHELISSGLWSVIRPDLLPVPKAGAPKDRLDDPATWLGRIGDDGKIQPGCFQLGVWGFDSV